MSKAMKLIPELRFPEFKKDGEWEIKQVDEYFDVGSSKRVLQKDWTNKGIPFYRTRELVSLSKNEPFGSGIYISEGLYSELKKKYGVPSEGDFLVSGVGTLGISYQVKKSDKFYFKDGNVLWFELKGDLNSLYFKFCFESKHIQNQIKAQTSKSTVGTYTIQNAKKTEFWFPPKPQEQKKIASCLSSLDELIAAHSDKLETLKDHKKGLMQNLFPQKGQKVPNYRFPEFEKDGEWVEKKLGSEISYFKGFAFKSKDYTSIGRRIVRVSDMGFDYIKNEDKAIFIKEEDTSQYEKWELQENDLIITTVGSKPPVYDSLVGRTIVVKAKDEGSLLNQNAVCLRANKNIEQVFLNSLFKRSEYIHFIESIIRGNANQGSITLENLFQYKIIVPKSKKEQKKIESCLSALDEIITAQSEKIELLQQHKKGLMRGLFPKIES